MTSGALNASGSEDRSASKLTAAAIGVRAAAWIAVIPLILLHVTLRDEAFDAEAGVCAGLLASMALLALAYTKPRTLPALAGILIKFYIGAGTAVFQKLELIGVRGRIRLSHDGLTKALLAVALLVILCVLAAPLGSRWGAIIGPRIARLTAPPRGYSVADSIAVRTVALTCVVVYCAVTTYTRGTSSFGGLEHVVTLVASSPLPLTLLFMDVRHSQSIWGKVCFGVAMALYVLVGLGSGMLGAAAEPVVVAAVLQWSIVGRAPWRTGLPFLGVLILLNTAKLEYRALTWNRDRALGLTERLYHWVDAIDRTYSGQVTAEAQRSATSAATRIQIVAQIAQVIDWVPGVVPFAGPEVWLTLPLEFIPRFMWQEKPIHNVQYNSRYTLTFRLQHERTMGNTSLALPPAADGYWRLGWLGVAIEGVLLGLLTGFYTAAFRASSNANVALGVMFAATVSAELHVMGLVAGQPQQMIAVVGMVLVIQQLTRLVEGKPFAERSAHVKPRGLT